LLKNIKKGLKNMQISNKVKMIGISGIARSGKDTFVGIAKEILSKNGYVPVRVAFADKLKEEVSAMLKSSGFGLDLTNLSPEEKERIRPLFVFWGCQRRQESTEGLYWVDVAEQEINNIMINYMATHGADPDKLVFLVSDVRFLNEANWIQSKFGGEVIHLKRFQIEQRKGGQDYSDLIPTKVYDSAPNEEELKNDPLVVSVSNHKIEWESKKKMTSAEAIKDPYLQQVVLDTLNKTKYFKHPSPITGILHQ
jgi:hypothetical protein